MTTSFPTILNPWYAVTHFQGGYDGADEMGSNSYWGIEDAIGWTDDRKKAQLFLSLHSAKSIAEAEGADILVIWHKGQLEDWGR